MAVDVNSSTKGNDNRGDWTGHKLAVIGPSTNSLALADLAAGADVVLHNASYLVGASVPPCI